MIIAIDGPVGTGKSTIAKGVAKKLGLIHFDTGAMYRTLTFGLMKHHIDPKNKNELEEYLNRFDFSIQIIDGEKHYFLEQEDVTKKIREPEVTAYVSEISAISMVREKLVRTQQQWAKGENALFEGRDIGTVVFPNAEIKIFLTASARVRAKRRLKEWKEKFPNISKKYTLQTMEKEITLRDLKDSTRKVSPLKKAKDAFEIDTSEMTIDEVIDKVITYVKSKSD